MASKSSVEIKIIAQDDASAPIENVIDKTKQLGAENKKVTKQSKKDWGGLGDLFGKVLPRDMQGLIRGFKGTQRQVGRLSRSFKVLKAAWASVGIGLILIALEELISNWDTVTDSINGVTKAQKEAEATAIDVSTAQGVLTREVSNYISTIQSAEATDEERANAIEKLNNKLGETIDLEADRKTQTAQANKLYKLNQELVAAGTREQHASNKAKSEGERMDKEFAEWLEGGANPFSEGGITGRWQMEEKIAKDKRDLDLEAKARQRDRIALELELNKLVGIKSKKDADAAKLKSESDKKAAEAQREAEAAYNKRIQKEKANAEWLAGERVRIAEEASLRIIQDDEKREQASLLIEQKKAEQELLDKGGDWQDLLRLGEEYEVERTAITDRYEAERKAQEDADKMQAEADALELKTQLQTDEQNELDALALFYDEKRALVQGDMEQYIALVKQEQQEEADIKAKYRDEEAKADIAAQNAKISAAIKMGKAIGGVVGTLSDLAQENSAEQKALAITEVLLSQAISIASAIAGANSAGSTTGVAAPVVTPLLMVQMVGSVLAGFAGVKKILNQAGASGGGVSGGSFGGRGGSSVASMASNVQVPLPARLDSPDAMQAYVVQSQLDGQLQSQAQLQGQVVL